MYVEIDKSEIPVWIFEDQSAAPEIFVPYGNFGNKFKKKVITS